MHIMGDWNTLEIWVEGRDLNSTIPMGCMSSYTDHKLNCSKLHYSFEFSWIIIDEFTAAYSGSNLLRPLCKYKNRCRGRGLNPWPPDRSGSKVRLLGAIFTLMGPYESGALPGWATPTSLWSLVVWNLRGEPITFLRGYWIIPKPQYHKWILVMLWYWLWLNSIGGLVRFAVSFNYLTVRISIPLGWEPPFSYH